MSVWTRATAAAANVRPFGPLCNPLDSFGPLWTPLDTFGPLWTPSDPFGPLWTSLGPFGLLSSQSGFVKCVPRSPQTNLKFTVVMVSSFYKSYLVESKSCDVPSTKHIEMERYFVSKYVFR